MDEQERILYIRTAPSIPSEFCHGNAAWGVSARAVNNQPHNKEVRMDTVKIDDVLRLQDLGLERLDEDQAILRFAQRAEERIARWLDFAKGALLMLMVPDDPESGCLYIYDRAREAFYSLGLPVEGRFGGFREDEFDGLCQAFGLKALAQNPQPLRV
jgi:hypothetical protein